jgi:hypothetical protein
MRHMQANKLSFTLLYLSNRRFQFWNGENEGLLAYLADAVFVVGGKVDGLKLPRNYGDTTW